MKIEKVFYEIKFIFYNFLLLRIINILICMCYNLVNVYIKPFFEKQN